LIKKSSGEIKRLITLILQDTIKLTLFIPPLYMESCSLNCHLEEQIKRKPYEPIEIGKNEKRQNERELI